MPNTVTVIDDFLSTAYIPTILVFLDKYTTININIVFTGQLVKEPFCLNMSVTLNNKEVPEQEKVQYLSNMFVEINNAIMHAVLAAKPIIH